jgi:serine/threonine-protein kinase
MIGQRFSHYWIEEKLGEGGMGEVFLARDLALGRPAAIKVLPSSFDEGLRRRLLREAEASRRLQHPGIATFFEAGYADATAFIAMEYVRGETLRARLRGGALPTATAFGLAAGLLEALGHAHVAGIIHRDIKPENIMATPDGTPKLLDFGLARQMSDAEARTVAASLMTEPGTFLGSIGYMAPEQLRCESADVRSDLFAVGAVLYEMLAGRPAFPGNSPAQRIAATLFGDPAPLPAECSRAQGVVLRSLARPRDQRYASAAEFLRDLRRLGEGYAVAAYPDTLAVLDFENRSGNPADAWIGVGIAENVAADLGRIADLGVVPRPKVAKAIATAGSADPGTVGSLLGCRWVLSGNYQKMGEDLRVLMQITHVPTQRVTATEKIDGRLGEVFAIQDRLAEKAAQALELRDRAAPPAQAAPGFGAYEGCTRGWQQWMRLSKGAFDQAEELFAEAVRQQADYPHALVGLAAVHDMRFTFTTDREELEQASQYARRAVALSPRNPAAHVWLAYALWRRGDEDEALAAIQRACDLDAANHYASYFHACFLFSLGRLQEALPLYQRSVELEPGFGFAWVGLAYAHMDLERYGESMWSFERAIEIESRGFHATAGAAGYLGECFRRQGRLEEARQHCVVGLEAVERTDHMYRDTFRAICLNVLGRAALDQGDREGAGAAFRQCELHLGGRRRTLGGGHLLAQALAGRAAADRDVGTLEESRARFERRDGGDWSWLWQCSDDVTRRDLERAAEAVGQGGMTGRS